MTDFNERIAELQYEAGMYQSLYENAVNVVAEKNDEIEKLKQELRILGVNRFQIFPELASIGDNLREQLK